MAIKTPDYWYDPQAKRPFWNKALPLMSALYGGVQRQHYALRARDTYTSTLPVICIGNITAGGSGKTPTAIALLALIKQRGLAKAPCMLTRGYGGRLAGPVLVDLKEHNASDVGDEAMLLARHAPTIICADRAKGARFAEGLSDIDMIIMDDGLQNPSLHKDISVMVISGEMGIGNGQLLPAGPMREPLAAGLSKSDAVIITGENLSGVEEHIPSEKPIMHAALRAHTTLAKDVRYLAFAGLGVPEKFFAFLRDKVGANIVDTRSFADHHPYSVADLEALAKDAAAQDATLITTEKDAVRLPVIDGLDVKTLPVAMEFADEDAIANLIHAALEARTA